MTQVQQTAPFRVGTAFMPMHRHRAVPGGGSGLCIMSAISVEKREAAWEFAKFATNTPNTVSFSQATGYMVVRTDATGLPEAQKFLQDNPNAKVTFDQMAYVRTQDSIAEVPQATPAIQQHMQQVLFDQKPAATVFDELQRQLTQLAQNVRK